MAEDRVDIDQLEKVLSAADLNPLKGYKFKAGGTLIDPEQCVSTGLTMLRANKNHIRFIPYYERLLELYRQINK